MSIDQICMSLVPNFQNGVELWNCGGEPPTSCMATIQVMPGDASYFFSAILPTNSTATNFTWTLYGDTIGVGQNISYLFNEAGPRKYVLLLRMQIRLVLT